MKTKKYKWSERQKEALRDSIHHWEGIEKGNEVDRGADSCPCCANYFANCCQGCPIFLYTGWLSCGSTPYSEWVAVAFRREDFSRVVHNDRSAKAAHAETVFLKKVLAAGE